MRASEIDQVWKRCRSVDRPALKVDHFLTVSGESGSPDLVCIPVESRVIALLGPNGAGKTSFLRSIRRILSDEDVDQARSSLRGMGFKYRGGSVTKPSADQSEVPPVVYVDVSKDVHEFLSLLARQAGFDDYKNQFGERVIGDGDLEFYGLIARRKYEEIRVREIERFTDAASDVGDSDDDREDQVFPVPLLRSFVRRRFL